MDPKETSTKKETKEAKEAYKEGDPVRVKATGQMGKVRVINSPAPGVVEVQIGANIAQYASEDIERVEEEKKEA
jgi:preprotein translocase subunit YajC